MAKKIADGGGARNQEGVTALSGISASTVEGCADSPIGRGRRPNPGWMTRSPRKI